ncbi:MAG: F0F1 ATP synthase subunit gamma [Granulosicoccaceae bacterium]
MASAKEIRTKIKSIQNTQKITKAMEMVAASKMRRAQDRMTATKPYAQKMREMVAHIAAANSEYRHSYLVDRPVKRVGVIVVSTDRGLCGGLNVNLFKRALGVLREFEEQDIEVDVCLFGRKAGSYFKRLNCNIVAEASGLGDAPEINDIMGAISVMLQAHADGKIDQLLLIQNEFVNTMTQQSETVQLIPVKAPEDELASKHWDYIYEPDAKDVIDGVMTRYIESLVYQGVVENVACEMAARMVAMKSASDNAGTLIGELQLVYNKARQAAITQEISEIVGGAAAVS